MIEGLKPYAEYKASGQAWLGEVPRHWQSFPLCRVAYLVSERGRPDLELLSVYLNRGVIRYSESSGQVHKPSLDRSNYQVVNPGNFVLNNQQAWRGSIGVSKYKGIISPAYVVMRLSNKMNPSYGNYLFRSPSMVAQYVVASRGVGDIQRNLYYPDLKRVQVIVPPLDEQAAIVRFLDHANRKFDGFIRAKRKLIALLNEQKQAIIHRAVTRGLNPEVKLKPSGIAWLGDIPAHWELSRVKNEFICLNSQRIPLSAVQRGAMTERRYDYYGASSVIDKVEDYLFDDELVLIAEDGANLVLRNLPLAIIARGKFWVNNHAHILKPKRGSLEYLASFMETLNYQPWISGAAQPKLTKDRLMSITLAVAPPPEQAVIVGHFTEQAAPLRAAIARTEREIALMQEYRTRLTADIVTGKLDVRAAAAQLPAATQPGKPVNEDFAGEMDEPELAEEE